MENQNPDEFRAAVEAEARRRLGIFADGIVRYNAFPRPARDAEAPPEGVDEIWRQGSTRLYDYGVTAKAGRHGKPVLLVPSLINRAHVLDLDPRHSLARTLAKKGFRPFLVDWGAPGEGEKNFTLSDYIAGRLAAALDGVVETCGGPAAVVGYCMGGNLALPLAQFSPDKVSSMVALATPWDFGAMTGAPVKMLQACRHQFDALIETSGVLPVDVLQSMFTSLSPFLAMEKFSRFAVMNPDSAEARHFVAMEDWLNDGVALVGGVARECLFDWYGSNTPGRGLWRVAGDVIDPRRVRCPALVVVPERDTIVPPESAAPLGAGLPDSETVSQPAGHIGMVAGRNGPARLYPLLVDWLRVKG